jgi:C_GCAxxG_C_C family probable redox protein
MNEISKQIGRRAADLFASRQLWCAPALLVSVNRGLDGELTDDLAIRMSTGFGEGLGGRGCLCGCVSGGTLALGLFLGNGQRSASGDKTVLKATHRLHQGFNNRFGSTCCRVLIKNYKRGSTDHFSVCAQRTKFAAERTASMILDQRPELIQNIDWDFLNQVENGVISRLHAVAKCLLPTRSARIR